MGTVVCVRIRTGPKKQQYAMIVHLAMTLSTVQGSPSPPPPPLESKKHETKNRLAKPGQGMPVSTHDSRPRTPVVVARATSH